MVHTEGMPKQKYQCDARTNKRISTATPRVEHVSRQSHGQVFKAKGKSRPSKPMRIIHVTIRSKNPTPLVKKESPGPLESLLLVRSCFEI